MPEPLQKSELDIDPTVSKQWDSSTPLSEQIQDLYHIIDGQKFCMLNTYRPGTGPVGRSMGVAKRSGPDLLFLANKNSKKFDDISSSSNSNSNSNSGGAAAAEVQVCFQDSKTQNWVSVTGTASLHGNDDPRVKELYGPYVKAWFGDAGDGRHDGSENDPRIALIEVHTSYIAYWKSEVGALGFIKEVGAATLTGKVADTGRLREMGREQVEQMRRDG